MTRFSYFRFMIIVSFRNEDSFKLVTMFIVIGIVTLLLNYTKNCIVITIFQILEIFQDTLDSISEKHLSQFGR